MKRELLKDGQRRLVGGDKKEKGRIGDTFRQKYVRKKIN